MLCAIKYIDCVDDPNGYAGYGCRDNQAYCEYRDSGIWFEKFRAACRVTCDACLGKKYTIHYNLHLMVILNFSIC